MPRNYKKPLGVQPKRNYDPKRMEAAVKVGKLSYHKASELYQVPKSIENKVNKCHPGSMGGQPVLSPKEEMVNEILPPSEDQPEDGVLEEEEAFVVVNYYYYYEQGRKLLMRQYVGVVTDVGAKDIEVKFLRSYCNSQSVFIFPAVDDEDRVPK